VQQPPKQRKKTGKLNRDTGFPEPLSEDRNTTLPHPAADTGPNAVLEGDAGSLSLTVPRTRRSFLSRNKSPKGGLIALPIELNDNSRYGNGGQDIANTRGSSEDSSEQGANEEVPRDSGVAMGDNEKRDEHEYMEKERKKGVLKILHLPKV